MSYRRFEEIFQASSNHFSGDERALFHNFLESYYALSADEDLDGFSADSLCATAAVHFQLLLKFDRKGDLVHVYNPNKAEHGYDGDCSVLDLVVSDRPFLVDSVLMTLNRLNLSTHFIVHPIFNYQKDTSGQASLSFAESSDRANVSVIHVEFDKLPDASLANITDEITRVLHMIDQTVNDWRGMEDIVKKVIAEIQTSRNLPQTAEDIIEATNFLQWLVDGNFTFLGYREYTINENKELFSVGGSGLGVLKDDGVSRISSSFEKLPEKIKAKALEPRLLLFSKSNNLSVIHRPVYMDFIGVKRFDENGQVIGEHRFLGLLTAAAYRLFPKQIPMLSHKIDKIISATKLPKNSHVAKTFENILTQMPRDELFQASVENIKEMAMGIFHLSERAKIRAFTRIDTYETYISCFIFVPKEKYNTKLRRKIQNYLLEITNGYSAEFATRFSESLHVRLEILVRTRPGEINEFSDKEIERAVAEMVTGWDDTVQSALQEQLGLTAANALFKNFERTTPVSYKQDFLPLQATEDFQLLSQLNDDNPLIPELYLPQGSGAAKAGANLGLKLYGKNEQVNLSAILPILERFGFSVISATPYQFSSDEISLGWVINFLLKTDVKIDNFAVVKEQFAEAFLRIWHNIAESDNLDGLIFNETLVSRDIMVLRAIAKYMQQAKVSFSQEYIHNTLNKHEPIAELLVRLFHCKFDPADTANRDKEVNNLVKQIEGKLQDVSSLDEDKILRWYLVVINAMLRTNFYQVGENGAEKPYLSFKLSSKDIPDLPRPKPLYEIFVYSPYVEAIHLRGGKVARGGLRWSDRMEDFRTEVLGLVKAQIVKNAVIVPVGSKGGFVVKKMPKGERDTVMQEVIRCYKMFISGMLDITDNIIEGKVVPPQNVYRYDEDDPYLVVAADKGTASFSDIANGVAIDYNFWLGDAFASGGSVGYDHKGMGITARGAWESVKRHFRHLGKDIQEKDDFTVVGIGDMAGDVFGNGMLLSKHTKLVAAFNHMHIFLDPNPDTAKSFEERKRLFTTPRTTWDDFDKSLISAGGGVHSRSEKSIKITPEVAEVLAIEEAELSPTDLINRILQAPVDLLWNGGIGTYVKAESQSHAEVGDKANDALRINGNQLRCKVVGEGGNLGFTQLGRIEYAKTGGRILTDAIDNSAGVNCSDHEVNIKILLNQAVEKGELTVDARNELLASMTEEVGRLVLRQNYQQPQAISLGEMNKNLFVDHARIMRSLEKSGQLDRAIENLPDDKEIKRRLENNEGLTPPELAILLAYSKINLFGTLVESTLPDDEVYQADLRKYFPTPLRETYTAYMQTHPLKREIIATFLTNSIMNHMGSVFILRACEETGKRPDQVVRAYTVSRNAFGAVDLWNAIDALDNKIDANLQNELHLRVRRLIELASVWFLQNRRDDNTQTIEADFAAVGEAVELLPKIMPQAGVDAIKADHDELISKGVPAELANKMALLGNAFLVLDIIELARQTDYQVEAMGSLYFKVGEHLQAGWIRDSIQQLMNNDYWRRRACGSITQQLISSINEITKQASQHAQNADDAFNKWLTAESEAIDSYLACVNEVEQDSADMSRLSVVIGEMAVLARKPQ